MQTKLLIPKQEIELAIRNLAEKIDLTNIFMIALREGAIPFRDLLLEYLWHKTVASETIEAKSYNGMVSAGDVQIEPGFNLNLIKGKNVLLIDDIFDTGQTLSRVSYVLGCYQPAILKTAVLLYKEKERKNIDVIIDHACFHIQDKFVIGFGMDLDGKYRDLSEIYEIIR